MEPVKSINIFIAAIAANLSAFVVGICLGWSSPVLFNLKSNDTSNSPIDHKITSDEEAWISSFIAIGALITPFAAGILADKIGRKWTLLSSSLYFILAYVLLLIVSEVWMMYMSRLIMGLGIGIAVTVIPMYVGEISSDQVRGATGSLMQLFIVIGYLYVYSIGPYVSYKVLQWCCMAAPIIFGIVFFFMPESPYFFAAKERQADATKSLQFLRGQSAKGVENEVKTIQRVVDESNANRGTLLDLFKNRTYRKALIISVGLVSFQQLSGITVVLFNVQSIFNSANISLDPAIAAIIIGVVQVVASSVTPFVVDRLGRKIILLISAGGMSIGLAALGAFFFIQLSGGDVDSIHWLPVAASIFYIFVYCIGFGSLPWVVLGEIFPTNVKSIAVPITASACWALAFITAFFYPALEKLGSFYEFWMFGIFCIIAFFFVLFVVMETKNLSLQEIQDTLNNKNA